MGMDFAIAGSPGWSETGGPWVPPAQGMKKYVWTSTNVDGGRPVSIVVPRPPSATGPFGGMPRAGLFGTDASKMQASGDGPVIAFREMTAVPSTAPLYASSAGPLPALADAPDDLTRVVMLPIPKAEDAYVDVDMGTAVSIGALTIASDPLPRIEILASDDGVAYHSIRRVEPDGAETPAAQQTIAFAPVTARIFRVRFSSPLPPRALPGLPAMYAPILQARPSAFALRIVRFRPGSWVDRFEAKAGFQPVTDFDAPTTQTTVREVIDPSAVVDLTHRIRPDSTLDWTPPPGRWTILRFGWSLTGAKNGPAEPASTGLEVDKLDPMAVRAYVDKLFSLYHDDVGAPLGAKGINSLLTDSWEAGVQNWTPEILTQFHRLRGYDPTPWLPVLAGHVVGDSARSDAFLFDFRQTLKDLVVENHYGVLAAAAHRQGMTYYTEVQGDTPRAISDGMTAKARSDVPTGEFWYRPFSSDPGQPSLVADLQEAASAAHVYGKPLVAAESMTVAAGNDPWAFSPAMLKPVADEIFACGVNRILIHDSHLQPFEDRKPGLILGFFGQFFNRDDTWAERARPWTDYLARTSFLLQQGQFVADIAYFYGEEKGLTQIFERHQNTDVPAGYGFDYISPEALLTKLSVREGRIVTTSGMRYRLLFVPTQVMRITVPALRKLDALVRAGAILVAHKPSGGLGMNSSDARVAKLANALWGDGRTAVRQVGRGLVYATATLADALSAERIVPDVQSDSDTQLLSVHRRSGDVDLYFVSNRGDHPVTTPVVFRVTGRAPEWWSAEDGAVRRLTYSQSGDGTGVSLPLDAKGAGFVVFRQPATARARTIAAPDVVSAQPIEGPWDVRFEPSRGAPAAVRFETLGDWSQNNDPGIRYFSGAATYTQTVSVDDASLVPGHRVLLDLGEVHDLATVLVNGVLVGTAWHAPYRLDLTGKLQLGSNRLEIEVINLWPNRLIGDKQPGATAVAYAPQSPYKSDSPLLPAGLIGPVRLLIETDRAQ